MDKVGKALDLASRDECHFWNELVEHLQKKHPSENLTPKFIWNLMWPAEAITTTGHVLFFYGFIQDIVLKRGLKRAIEHISPKNASWVDTKTAKVCRVAATAALSTVFNYYAQLSKLPLSKYELAQGFILNCIGATMKESRLGLPGSLGCSLAHNLTNLYSQHSCVR